jgi:hypothetical protein
MPAEMIVDYSFFLTVITVDFSFPVFELLWHWLDGNPMIHLRPQRCHVVSNGFFTEGTLELGVFELFIRTVDVHVMPTR